MGMATDILRLRGNRSPRAENPNYVRYALYGFKTNGEILDVSVADSTDPDFATYDLTWLHIQAEKHLTADNISRRFLLSQRQSHMLGGNGRFLGFRDKDFIMRVNPAGPLDNLKLCLVMQEGVLISVCDFPHWNCFGGKAVKDETSRMDVDVYDSYVGMHKLMCNSYIVNEVGDLFMNLLQKYVTHLEVTGDNLSVQLTEFAFQIENGVTHCDTETRFLTKKGNCFQQLCLAANQLELCVIESLDLCDIHPHETSFLGDTHKRQCKSILTKVVATKKQLFLHTVRVNSLLSQLSILQADLRSRWSTLGTFVFLVPAIISAVYGMNVDLPGKDHKYMFYILSGGCIIVMVFVALLFRIIHLVRRSAAKKMLAKIEP